MSPLAEQQNIPIAFLSNLAPYVFVFLARFFFHEDMTLSMAKMISLSKTRLGIHETKQENRDSDNDLFLCHREGKKFDEWGLFNFRCCLKPVTSAVWDDGKLYHISISDVLIILLQWEPGVSSLSLIAVDLCDFLFPAGNSWWN